MASRIERYWYSEKRPLRWLSPLAALFGWLVNRRRAAYASGRRRACHPGVPVLVVGNITVGGTGKSPFTAWLVRHLQQRGLRPVVLSRGYGASADHYPFLVTGDADPEDCGDEPVMLSQQTGAYVVVDPKRSRGAAYALEHSMGDVLICDDGLQHYALQRDLEFCIFDGARGIGNGALLPVGPLREPVSRAASVDFCMSTGAATGPGFNRPPLSQQPLYPVSLKPLRLRHFLSGESVPMEWLDGRIINAIAGIGNPGRFFDTLHGLGAKVIPHAYPDHHRFRAEELALPHGPLVMTAKDAVKCQGMTPDDTWVLDVVAEPGPEFVQALNERLEQLGEPANG